MQRHIFLSELEVIEIYKIEHTSTNCNCIFPRLARSKI